MSSEGRAPDLPNEESTSSEWDNVVHEASGNDQGSDGVVDKLSVPEVSSNPSHEVPSPVSSDEDWQTAVKEMNAGAQGTTNNVVTDEGVSQVVAPNLSSGKEDEVLTRSRAASPWEVADVQNETENIVTGDLLGFDDQKNPNNTSDGNDGKEDQLSESLSTSPWEVEDISYGNIASSNSFAKTTGTQPNTNLWDQTLEEPNNIVKPNVPETVVEQKSVPTVVSQQKVLDEIPGTNISSSEEEDEEGFILTKSRSEDTDQFGDSSNDKGARQVDLLKIQEDREKIAKAAELAASFMLGGLTSEDKVGTESQPTVPVKSESTLAPEPELEPSAKAGNVLYSSAEPSLKSLVTDTTELKSSTSPEYDSKLKSSESDLAIEAVEDLEPELEESPPSKLEEPSEQLPLSMEKMTPVDGKLNVVKRENPFEVEKDQELIVFEPMKNDQNDDASSKKKTLFDPFSGASSVIAATGSVTGLSTSSVTPVVTSQPGLQADSIINVGPATAAFTAATSITQPNTFHNNLMQQKAPGSSKKPSTSPSFRKDSSKKSPTNKKESLEIEMTNVEPKQSLLQKSKNKAETGFDDCASYQRWDEDATDEVSEISSGFLSHNTAVKSTARSSRSEFSKYSITREEAATEQARKLTRNRVRVVPLIFCGLFAIVTGVLGSMYANFTCHFASSNAKAGEYESNFHLTAGLWKYSPVDSVFEGYSYCSSYDYGATVEKLCRFFGLLALFAGTFSVVVLWNFLITVKTNALFWKLGVKSSLAAGFLQCGPFLLFKSEHCSNVGCGMGPGSFVCFLAVVTWFAMSYEMHHNCPISAQIKFNKPSVSTWWGSIISPIFEDESDKRNIPSLAEAFRRNLKSPPHGGSVDYVPPHPDSCPV